MGAKPGAPSHRHRAPPGGWVRIPGLREFRNCVLVFAAAQRRPRNQAACELS